MKKRKRSLKRALTGFLAAALVASLLPISALASSGDDTVIAAADEEESTTDDEATTYSLSIYYKHAEATSRWSTYFGDSAAVTDNGDGTYSVAITISASGVTSFSAEFEDTYTVSEDEDGVQTYVLTLSDLTKTINFSFTYSVETSYYSGTHTYPFQIVLEGGTYTMHELTYVEAKEATATEDGNIAYYTCETCGTYYSDAEGTTEIDEDDIVIAATGEEEEETASVAAGTYTVPVSTSDEVSAMGVDFGIVLADSATAVVNEDGSVTLTLNFLTDATITMVGSEYAVWIGSVTDAEVTTTTISDQTGAEQTAVVTATLTFDSVESAYEVTWYLASTVMSTDRTVSIAVDWDNAAAVTDDTTGDGSTDDGSTDDDNTDDGSTDDDESEAVSVDAGTYTVPVSISDEVTAMSVDFGCVLTDSATAVVNEDGTVTLTLTFATDATITMAGTEYAVWVSEFYGVYVDGELDTDCFEVTTTTDANGNTVVETVTLTLASAASSYDISYYLASDMMSYTRDVTLTVDWDNAQAVTADDDADADNNTNDGADSNTSGGTDNSTSGGTDNGTTVGGTNGNSGTQQSQTITVKNNKKTIKAKKLKKKKASFKLKATVSGNAKVTYKKLNKKTNKALKKGYKALKISKKGKVTVKKGTAKGTYKIKVQVSAQATSDYAAATRTVTVTVKVK